MRLGITERALSSGFDAIGFADAQAPWEAGARLQEFLALGYHGDMGWMATHEARRTHPTALWPDARSAIVLGVNYGPDHNPMSALDDPSSGAVSVYAQGADYHDLIKKRLKHLAGWIADQTGAEVKVFVDTAPLMEKPLAQRAGLGFQGKHTNLVSKDFGSWLFLGVILTTLDLGPDAPSANHCGTCSACLDICPTRAFVGPYQLDARRCISYLTIEHKGTIAPEFRRAIGNRIYGCDDCLSVCPWNKFASPHTEPGFAAIKRIGRARFLRNVLIAVGNSGRVELLDPARNLLTDDSPLVRAMAVWAHAQMMAPEAFVQLADQSRGQEQDPDVLCEWQRPFLSTLS
jgi:epoxyqueuosine reductase